MKNNRIKKFIALFTLACIMLVFSVVPSQAATLSTTTSNNTKVVHISAPAPNNVNDPIQSWTETTAMRTYTSTYFTDLEASVIENVLLYAFGVSATKSLFISVATAFINYWGASSGGHTGYEIIYYYWTPSNYVDAPYYVKKHVAYYTDSNYTNYIGATDDYYYSTVPY